MSTQSQTAYQPSSLQFGQHNSSSMVDPFHHNTIPHLDPELTSNPQQRYPPQVAGPSNIPQGSAGWPTWFPGPHTAMGHAAQVTQPAATSTAPHDLSAFALNDTTPSRTRNTDRSTYDAAKGLAMISLEAAAEPHYVGESSGFIWTAVLGQGMTARSSSNSVGDESDETARRGSVTPKSLSAYRSRLKAGLSDDVAAEVLRVVYEHVQPRVCARRNRADNSIHSWIG